MHRPTNSEVMCSILSWAISVLCGRISPLPLTMFQEEKWQVTCAEQVSTGYDTQDTFRKPDWRSVTTNTVEMTNAN